MKRLSSVLMKLLPGTDVSEQLERGRPEVVVGEETPSEPSASHHLPSLVTSPKVDDGLE